MARRIAHEIRNPLTPIQLSAERIKRKYSRVIVEDRDVFEQCTDTIIRQVGDVTRMVDEFSAFARMPKPQMEDHDIRDVVRASVLDRQMGNGDIAFDKRLGDAGKHTRLALGTNALPFSVTVEIAAVVVVRTR